MKKQEIITSSTKNRKEKMAKTGISKLTKNKITKKKQKEKIKQKNN